MKSTCVGRCFPQNNKHMWVCLKCQDISYCQSGDCLATVMCAFFKNGEATNTHTLLKIKVLQKVLQVMPQKNHFWFHKEPFSQRPISFLPFYNLKNLLSPQRSFCETERFFRCQRSFMEPFRQKGSSMASWSSFIFKSVMPGWMTKAWHCECPIYAQWEITYVYVVKAVHHIFGCGNFCKTYVFINWDRTCFMGYTKT